MQKSDHPAITPRTGDEIWRDFARFELQAYYFDQDELAPHTHEHIEVVYVVRGQASHFLNGRKFPLIPGDFFVINTDEEHGYADVDELRIVNILTTPKFLSGHLSVLNHLPGFSALFSLEPLFRAETSFQHKLHLPGAARGNLELAIAALVNESTNQAQGCEVFCTAHFLHIIGLAARAFASREHLPTHRDFRGKESAVAQAVAYLESQLEKEISMDDVASFVCLSPSRLRHLFKETTGTSLMDYLLRCRLDRAREMIRRENRKISEIAYAVGFHDPDYFSRAYRKHFGHSPRQDAIARK